MMYVYLNSRLRRLSRSNLTKAARMSRGSTRLAALLSAVVFTYSLVAQNPPVTPAPAAAQAPGQAPGQGQRPRGPRPAPTNIKALPKNISGDDLIKLMHQYEGDLGVQCEFCHAQDPATRRNNFASDANPTKEVARYMITMTADINDKWLEGLPDRRYADPVTCGTCHRGEKHPSVFVPTPQTHAAPPATPAAQPTTPPVPPAR